MDSDPLLLTPGPLSTTTAVKEATLHDLGSRDAKFIQLTRDICNQLEGMVNASNSHSCVPLQGSGTFALEAMLGTLLPYDGKLLNLINGAYGHRLSSICNKIGRAVQPLEFAEQEQIDLATIEKKLADDPDISHVSVVYCETTSGVLNPVHRIAELVHKHGKHLFVDAMSAFGALPLDITTTPCAAIAASSNKCLQGIPGMSFVIVENELLANSKDNSHSISLDLHAQWQGLKDNGQWRFTPPVQCLLALDRAMQELRNEGGPAGRLLRYQDNAVTLLKGMRKLGFKTFLAEEVQAPIIVTFHIPADPVFEFERFYDLLQQQGYVIYPGKLTREQSFRVGCIGAVNAAQMQRFVDTVASVLETMGVKDGSP